MAIYEVLNEADEVVNTIAADEQFMAANHDNYRLVAAPDNSEIDVELSADDLEKYWKDITKAVLVTSLLFAFIHMNSYWFIQIYLLGIFLGYLSWKCGSIIPSLILHSINNAAAILLSFTEIDVESFYLWKGHLSPIIILVALYLFFYGFRGINNSRLY